MMREIFTKKLIFILYTLYYIERKDIINFSK